MVKRASTVCASSALAEKRKALSGDSGWTWPTAGNASASAAPNATTLAARLITLRRGFGRDPLQISWKSMADRDNDDLRKFVWVARQDRGLQRRIKCVACLDYQLRFLGRFDFSAPVVQ